MSITEYKGKLIDAIDERDRVIERSCVLIEYIMDKVMGDLDTREEKTGLEVGTIMLHELLKDFRFGEGKERPAKEI